MTPFRIVFLTCAALTISGAYYLSSRGVWMESRDLDRSVRLGGPGGTSGTRIK